MAVGRTIWHVFTTAFSIVKGIASTISGLAFTGLKAGLAGIAAIGGAVYGTHKALGPAAEMERYRTQLDFMGKSDLLPFFQKLAAKSPLSMNETVSGGIMAENFNLDAKKFLPLAVDMSSAFKKPLEEIIRAFAYIKSGRTGEGMEAMRSMGISNEALKKVGIQFEKSGEVAEKSKGAMLDAIYLLANKRFSGMAAKQSETYEGKFSNLGDAVFQAFAQGLAKALPIAKNILDAMIKGVEGMTAKFAGLDWKTLGDTVSRIVDKASGLFSKIPWDTWGQNLIKKGEALANIAERLTTPEGRQEIKDTGMKAGGIIWDALPKLGTAIIADLKNLYSWAADKIGLSISKALTETWEVLKMVMAGSIEQALVTAFRSFYDSIADTLATLQAILYTFLNSLPFSGKFMTDYQKSIVKMEPEDQVKTLAAPIRKYIGKNVDKPTAGEEMLNALSAKQDADEKRLKNGPSASNIINVATETGKKLSDAVKPLFEQTPEGKAADYAEARKKAAKRDMDLLNYGMYSYTDEEAKAVRERARRNGLTAFEPDYYYGTGDKPAITNLKMNYSKEITDRLTSNPAQSSSAQPVQVEVKDFTAAIVAAINTGNASSKSTESLLRQLLGKFSTPTMYVTP